MNERTTHTHLPNSGDPTALDCKQPHDAAGRKPGSDRGRAAIDWNAAFLAYAGLPPERRSYQVIADQYEVSVRTVERHGRDGDWKRRARELDRDAAERAGEQIRDRRVDELLDTLKLIEAAVATFADQLRDGTAKVTSADLPRLHKLRTEIWELTDIQSSERQEQLRPVEAVDSTERKLEVLRALDDAGVLQRLLRPEAKPDQNVPDRPDGPEALDGRGDPGRSDERNVA